MNFSNTSKILSIEDFANLEIEIGQSIPDVLKKHYLKYNGGIPNARYFYQDKYDSYCEIKSFLPIYDELTKWTLEYTYLFYKNKNAFPEQYIPFATDYGDNLFCINTSTKSIVLIYLDMGEITESNGSIRYLANNFNVFIENLEVDIEEDDPDEDFE